MNNECFSFIGNPVVITSTFTDKTLRYGEKLKKDCKAQGLPTPTIKWNTPTGNVSGANILPEG